MPDSVNITRRAVLEIIGVLERLFTDGAGLPLYSDENTSPVDLPGAIDDTTPGTPAWTFMNNSLMAIRFIVGVLRHVVDTEDGVYTAYESEEEI